MLLYVLVQMVEKLTPPKTNTIPFANLSYLSYLYGIGSYVHLPIYSTLLGLIKVGVYAIIAPYRNPAHIHSFGSNSSDL